MRKIDKGEPLPEFLNETASLNSWDDFDSTVKTKTRKQILIKEQNRLSAYTERILEHSDDRQNTKLHIDHFRKKSMFPGLTFDWNNLLIDEKEKPYGADYKDEHIKKTDYQDIINPVDEDPQSFFEYMLDGTIIPKRDFEEGDPQRKRAERTIELFNLNETSLREERKVHLTQIIYYLKGGLTEDDILDSDKKFPSLTEFICRHPDRQVLLSYV